jgi:NDP-sugar pyrophosphorylase family protein
MKEVVILAGGKGERLRPLTEDRPKAMVEIMGSPILAYQLKWLCSYGIKRVVISCGYLHEVIEDFFGDGSKWGLEIEYVIEREALGRGGGLKQGLSKLGSGTGPVLALNGDLVTNLNLQDLERFHKKHNPLATIVTVPLKSPYGIVEFGDDINVCGFAEKPVLPYFINSGIYVLSRDIKDHLPDRGDHEELTFPKLSSERRLIGFKTDAFWRTVDTVKDVGELRAEFEKMLFGSFFQPAVS